MCDKEQTPSNVTDEKKPFDLNDPASPFTVTEDDETIDYNAAVALAYGLSPAIIRAIRETQSLMPAGSSRPVLLRHDFDQTPFSYVDLVRKKGDDDVANAADGVGVGAAAVSQSIRWVPTIVLNDAVLHQLSPEAQAFSLTYDMFHTARRFERLGAFGAHLETGVTLGICTTFLRCGFTGGARAWGQYKRTVSSSSGLSVSSASSSALIPHAGLHTHPSLGPYYFMHHARNPPNSPHHTLLPTLREVVKVCSTRVFAPVFGVSYALLVWTNYQTDVETRQFTQEHGHRRGAISYFHSTMTAFDRAAYDQPSSIGLLHRARCLITGNESIASQWLRVWEKEEEAAIAKTAGKHT